MINTIFLTILLALIVIVSLIFPIVIEAIKKLVGDDVIIKTFKKMEIFCFILTLILATITYLIFLLFYINAVVDFITGLKLFVCGFVFILACGCGSQVGYDKVIKTIKDIWEILKGLINK